MGADGWVWRSYRRLSAAGCVCYRSVESLSVRGATVLKLRPFTQRTTDGIGSLPGQQSTSRPLPSSAHQRKMAALLQVEIARTRPSARTRTSLPCSARICLTTSVLAMVRPSLLSPGIGLRKRRPRTHGSRCRRQDEPKSDGRDVPSLKRRASSRRRLQPPLSVLSLVFLLCDSLTNQLQTGPTSKPSAETSRKNSRMSTSSPSPSSSRAEPPTGNGASYVPASPSLLPLTPSVLRDDCTSQHSSHDRRPDPFRQSRPRFSAASHDARREGVESRSVRAS